MTNTTIAPLYLGALGDALAGAGVEVVSIVVPDGEACKNADTLSAIIDRLIADQYGFEQRKAYARKPGGYDPALWTQYAELGLLGLTIPEEHGGMGFGPIEAMVVLEELGRGLVNEPYGAAALMVPALLQPAPEALRAAWLPKIGS